MKLPRLITRRRVKWMGTAAFVLMAVAWPVSYFTGFEASRGIDDPMDGDLWEQVLIVARGNIGVYEMHLPNLPGIRVIGFVFEVFYEPLPHLMFFRDLDRNPRVDFAVTKRFSAGMDWHIIVPIWLPLLLIAAPTAWLWRTDRRAKPWQCPKCRYDLRGLDGGVCPECGTPIAEPTA